mmetsp:Transcript_44886/g.73126  ORF Transcript_44886/g.73126 Transcript_44886/m.73126 type:complete len:314 (+) Transcript_44886:865-1806(+)
MNLYFNVFDIIRLTNPPRYYDNYGSDKERSFRKQQSEDELSFPEAVYSFVFGDGNPNADIEETQWQLVGDVIRRNRGVVVAEQILPFLDTSQFPNTGSYIEREDYMLPVLLRFNGQGEVSPEGGIVYVFPELQTTAKRTTSQPPALTTDKLYLKEKQRVFSKASDGQKLLVGGLGVVNFLGVIFLSQYLPPPAVAAAMGGLVSFASSSISWLAAYAASFAVIPLIRAFYQTRQNIKIQQRNAVRMSAAEKLQFKSKLLSEKLQFAKQFVSESVISDKDILYGTDQDYVGSKAEELANEEWTRQLQNTTDSKKF